MSNTDRSGASSADAVFHHWLDPIWQFCLWAAVIGSLVLMWRLLVVDWSQPDTLASLGFQVAVVAFAISYYTRREAVKHHPNTRRNKDRL